MPRFFATLILGTGLAFALVGAVQAADPVQQHNSNAVWFENWIGLSNATLVVAAPNGKITQIHAANGTPVYELEQAIDGVYRYELRAATQEQTQIVTQSGLGRDESGKDTAAVPYYATGSFVVERGAIITPDVVQEEEEEQG